jgi:hypothetical protein
VPDWVFAEFGTPPEKRAFRYEAMLYDRGYLRDHWQPGASVPDMSKLETRMWFYYRACRYIDAGFEAIHFGQVHLMALRDKGYLDWFDLLGRVRHYAALKARRHFVLCDAHTHGVTRDGKLLFDFHAWPLRPKEMSGQPQRVELAAEWSDSIIGHSDGGVTPSGWDCLSLPYLVEIDNFGSSGKGGQANLGSPWVWGYDEISWFAHQSETYRNAFVRYAWNWVRNADPGGYFEIPTRRNLADPVMLNGASVAMYQANDRSEACPVGFGQEDAIQALWSRRPTRR